MLILYLTDPINITLQFISSRLNVHLMFASFPENRKTIPKFLVVKKLLKNVTTQILNFIPVS